jgi:hypothetical protein
MIKIGVDEGYAYDMLAIQQVKYEKSPSPKSEEAMAQLGRDILQATSVEHHLEIVWSKEHQDLIETNQKLFELIDELNKHPADCSCYGCQVNRLNYIRFLCKRALQAKFFPENAPTEQKLGYRQAENSPPTTP